MPLNRRKHPSLRKGQELWDKAGQTLLWMPLSRMWSLPSDPLPFLLLVGDLALWPRVYKLTTLLQVCPRDRGSPSPPSLYPPPPSDSGTKTQCSPASHHFGVPVSTLGPFEWISTLLWKWTCPLERSEHATLLSISLRPSLVLWIKFKILPLVFIALYNSGQLPLAHNCCNDLSVVAIHSYTPKSTPPHTSAHKHGMCWWMKDRGTIKAKSSMYFC